VPKEPTAEELMGDKPAAAQQQAMCGGCRNMAMMGRGTPSMPGMTMPGMNMPARPATPEQPKQ
jgi:hypothetical protein